MTRPRLFSLFMAGLALVCGLAGGCLPEVASLDKRELGDPLMRRAHAKAVAGDSDGAIKTYMKLIDIEPKIARAHLDIALLFDDGKKDYIRAIYHYQRYLELRPKTEKRGLIESRIRLASQGFAAGAFRPGRTAPPEDIAELKKKNAELREKAAQLQRELDLAQSAARTRVAAVVAAPTGPSHKLAPETARSEDARPAKPGRYVVQAGERLKEIADRHGVTIEEIAEANGLSNPNRIMTGQELVIPVLSGR
ncbi:MAG: LysM peptidoglycan-binding domain-containing protein [Verrucomicrobiota bacterium]|nr:LysM peptidoglycan-binding domain-containing protein [Verrucomicrobiota bacterium]